MVERTLKKLAQQFGITVYLCAIVGNQVHLPVKLSRRFAFAPFLPTSQSLRLSKRLGSLWCLFKKDQSLERKAVLLRSVDQSPATKVLFSWWSSARDPLGESLYDILSLLAFQRFYILFRLFEGRA
jgi:hypothetical protein